MNKIHEERTITLKVAVTSLINAMGIGNQCFTINGFVVDSDMPERIERDAGRYFFNGSFVQITTGKGGELP